MSEPSVLLEIKSLLDDLAKQSSSRDEEILNLVKDLFDKFEPLEHEIFHTEGVINDFRLRIEEIERQRAEEKEVSDSRKKFWKDALSKGVGTVLGLALLAALAKFGIPLN